MTEQSREALKQKLILEIDVQLHSLIDRENVPLDIKAIACLTHTMVHGLAGLLSNDPEIRAAVDAAQEDVWWMDRLKDVCRN